MTYELAKELKEAGFPQTEELYCRCGFLTMEQTDGVPVIYDCKTERISKPTLEELIEACGEGFRNLSQDDEGDEWMCNNYFDGFENIRYDGYTIGSTPTEAVAKLWLALNKVARK